MDAILYRRYLVQRRRGSDVLPLRRPRRSGIYPTLSGDSGTRREEPGSHPAPLFLSYGRACHEPRAFENRITLSVCDSRPTFSRPFQVGLGRRTECHPVDAYTALDEVCSDRSSGP